MKQIGTQLREKTSVRPTVLGVVFWTAVGLVFALSRLGSGERWQALLLHSLLQWWIWGVLTPLIIAGDRRLPFTGQQLLRRTIAHLLIGPLWTFVYVYCYATLAAATGPHSWSSLVKEGMQGLFWHMLIYLLIVGVAQAYQYQQRYASAELRMERLERSFSEARLNALRMQLDPHFLFNALNTISAQVSADPRLARRMIEHLGDLLRLSLESQGRQEIPLAEEVAFLGHYLAIQKIRFGDKLRVEIRISSEAACACVPSLFLQPLVENAIRHGISSRAAGGSVTVTADRASSHLEVQVLDDGVGLPSGWSLDQQTGLGLALTRERIAGLHPEGSTRFSLHGRPGGGTQVSIAFPYRRTESC